MSETAGDADRFATAHAALKADSSIQFDLAAAPPPPQTPGWLKSFLEWLGNLLEPVGRLLKWIGSFMPDAPLVRIFLWIVLAAGACALAFALYERWRSGVWRVPSLRRTPVLLDEPTEEWIPEEAPAREWLSEADTLAAQGSFAEAVHLLLLRSIEDIGRRRPSLVKPALTSREIGASEAVPERARKLFVEIALMVERSLFGGRTVDASDWASARDAYSDFALSKAWR